MPIETVIVTRDREQRPFVNFAQLCIIIQEEEEERKRLGVILASFKGKDRDSKRRKKPYCTSKLIEILDPCTCCALHPSPRLVL